MSYSIDVCGFCHRSAGKGKRKTGKMYALLVPVVVESRGKHHLSRSHVHCLQKWNRVSAVKIEGDSAEAVEARRRLNKYRLKKQEWHQRVVGHSNNKCIDCGYSIQPTSTRCLTCSNRENRRKRKVKGVVC